jgi:hypothetical protein
MAAEMKYYSQAGQDHWVFDLFKGKRGGTFLDVGANHPIEISNSFALESQLGWRGFLIDNDDYCCELCRRARVSPIHQVDSTKFDYKSLPVRDFDYLSLDVDDATLESLKKLLADGVTFRCATIEHDSYRFGPRARDAMRELLAKAGYKLERADVCNIQSPDMPYEDWWVDPKRV